MTERDLVDQLAAAGIAGEPELGPAGPTGPILFLTAPDAQSRSAWLRGLQGLQDRRRLAYWPVAISEDLDLESTLISKEAYEQTLVCASERLAALDRWRRDPEGRAAVHPVEVVLGWMKTHPEGAPLSTLLAALRDAAPVPLPAPPARRILDNDPIDYVGGRPLPLRLACFPVQRGAHVLASIGFGGWNACPTAELQVATMMRWERDLGVRLLAVSADEYHFAMDRPPGDDAGVLRLFDEILELNPSESPVMRAPSHALRRVHQWRFWWD
jgi:hypothetical protein